MGVAFSGSSLGLYINARRCQHTLLRWASTIPTKLPCIDLRPKGTTLKMMEERRTSEEKRRISEEKRHSELGTIPPTKQQLHQAWHDEQVHLWRNEFADDDVREKLKNELRIVWTMVTSYPHAVESAKRRYLNAPWTQLPAFPVDLTNVNDIVSAAFFVEHCTHFIRDRITMKQGCSDTASARFFRPPAAAPASDPASQPPPTPSPSHASFSPSPVMESVMEPVMEPVMEHIPFGMKNQPISRSAGGGAKRRRRSRRQFPHYSTCRRRRR